MPARGTLVGGLLAAIAGVILLRSFVFTAGYDTTLVANLGHVRAPFTGIVHETRADLGDRVIRDQIIAGFAAQVGLTAMVRGASEDEHQLKAQIASIDTRIASLGAMAAKIRAEARAYQMAKVARMEAATAEAGADISAAEAGLEFAQTQYERSQELWQRGFVSKAGLEKARQERDAAKAARAAARARQRGDLIEQGAAAQGLLVGSGYSDVQYSTQRLSELGLALDQLQGERDVLATSLASQTRLSSGNTASSERQVRIPLRASVSGRVWSKAAAVGELVREGEPIYLLADCTSFFAYFTVGRTTYSSLQVGEAVTFVSFANGDHWPGQIVNLGVNDPTQLRFTSEIEKPAEGRYLVGARIELHSEDQRECPVGSPGRVVLGGE